MAASTILSTNRDALGKKAGSKNKSAPTERPAQPPIRCPECHSSRSWKDGLRYIRSETGTINVQRYICRECGRRFSETISYLQPNRLGYNRQSESSTCQVCVALAEGSKNLVRVESRIEKRAAGATTPSEADIKGKTIEYLWYLKRQGYAESTVRKRVRFLKRLVGLGADLFDQESVKEIIAKQKSWCEGTKYQAVDAYATFARMTGLAFDPPRYRQAEKLPFIPTEEDIDQLIAGCGKKIATCLQLVKETGMRRGEAWRLEWIDIDSKNKTVTVDPEKGSNPRMLPISSKLIGMLNNLPNEGKKIWNCSRPKMMSVNLHHQREKIARKLNNPRIQAITFCTLRHWKATTEYHRTKDILHVMKTLGHKSIENTLIYIDLEKAIYEQPHNQEFTARVAKTLEEACDLIEAGFEFVTGEYHDGGKIFRRRK